MRYSRQRELVLRQVQNRCDHPTADDIYLAIREDCPGLSLGTVYRNLNGLVEMGRVRRVSIPGMADRFDRTLSEHDHLYCTRCGKVEDVFLDKTAVNEMIEARKDLAIEHVSLNLYGLCSACRDAARS
ncbi:MULTISPECIES: transcriptional repressor [Eubacteriales]|uniref:Fur family transcriptional regulator n=1 Tax=Eubacteriales TaxID=186802 RepID=UPI000B394301|nr:MULTISPECIES: transcriptional repressor [Eubacteriales]MDY4168212.1 transcriptional repressor [Fournierella sp.]OUP22999.1 transcriptional repressor [Gemmiger sp. An194]